MDFNADQERAIEWQCLKVLTSFYRSIDTANCGGIGSQLHPEGTWIRAGNKIRTQEEITADFAARPQGQILFHVVNNAIFKHRSSTHVDFSLYLSVARGRATLAPPEPNVFQGVQGIHLCQGEMWRTPEAWKIGLIDAGPPILRLELGGGQKQ